MTLAFAISMYLTTVCSESFLVFLLITLALNCLLLDWYPYSEYYLFVLAVSRAVDRLIEQVNGCFMRLV